MRQKYLMEKNDEANELIIKEFAELDTGVFSIICEETYKKDMLDEVLKKDKVELISALRTSNLYPVSFCMEKIADAVVELYRSEENEAIEIQFDDLDLIASGEDAAALDMDDDEELDEIDNLLDDEIEDSDLDDNDPINIIASPKTNKLVDDDNE